jgi:hypothetical protein
MSMSMSMPMWSGSLCSCASQSSQRGALHDCGASWSCWIWMTGFCTGGAGSFQNECSVDFCTAGAGCTGILASDIMGSACGCLRCASNSFCMVFSELLVSSRSLVSAFDIAHRVQRAHRGGYRETAYASDCSCRILMRLSAVPSRSY